MRTPPDSHPIRDLLRAAQGAGLPDPYRLKLTELGELTGVTNLASTSAPRIQRGMTFEAVAALGAFVERRAEQLRADRVGADGMYAADVLLAAGYDLDDIEQWQADGRDASDLARLWVACCVQAMADYHAKRGAYAWLAHNG